MSWDRIVSLIGTMAAVIACVCSVLSLIKMKKSSIDPTKIFRGVIVLVTVAAVALVTGIIVSWINPVWFFCKSNSHDFKRFLQELQVQPLFVSQSY